MKQQYDGSCHCGKVEFRATLDLGESIVCDCSICIRKGSIVVRVSEAEFELSTPLDKLSLYTFNRNIARHYFCPTCGIHAFHRPRSCPELWCVNVRCLEGVTIDDIEPRQVYGSKLD